MSDSPRYQPYQPQLEPVEIAQDIWTVEGPEIDYRLAGLSLPCPTRMTVIRLHDGALWLHSPVCLTDDLAARLDALGPVGAIIAPNGFHTSHTQAWAERCPDAQVFAPRAAFGKIACARSRALDDLAQAAWLAEIDHHFVDLGSFGESLFFHRASATLIVTDVMQNFESERIASPLTRLVLTLGGATGPKGGPSIEIRLAMLRYRQRVREAVRTMIAWRPARIVLSHGKCFEGDAANEITRGFGWIA
jgi:pimeloyl-ACP methyl ester carboxylesterase